MRMNCRERWASLVDFAEGKTSRETEAHLATCEECRKEVARLRRAFAAGSLEMEPAPQELVDWAAALMPKRLRVFRMVRTSLQLSVARAVSQDFQAIYQLDEEVVRVAYNRTESGWEVVSQLPPSTQAVEHQGKQLVTDQDGRFFFVVQELPSAGFTLRSGSLGLEVPSPEEASRGLD